MPGVGAVDIGRVLGDLETLATMSAGDGPGVTRLAYTPEDQAAHDWLAAQMEVIGLTVEMDGLGNLFGWAEPDRPEPAVLAGSHLDTVRYGGRYDGALGVCCALEALRILLAADLSRSRPLGMAVFRAEESARFGVGCVGSRGLSGDLSLEALSALRDAEGISLPQALSQIGLNSEGMGRARREPGWAQAFLEVHIEQGARLWRSGATVGIVTHIAAPQRFTVVVTGEADHSGATLMDERHDALAAASEVVLLVEATGRRYADQGIVTTVGLLNVFPNAMNTIPGRVEMGIDLRTLSQEAADAALDDIRAGLDDVIRRRGVDIALTTRSRRPPVQVPEDMVVLLEGLAAELGIRARRMVSRAAHDAMYVARLAPIGMLFVPNPSGLSHCPHEEASAEGVEAAAALLAQAMARMASGPK